jgi:hypothetical protein
MSYTPLAPTTDRLCSGCVDCTDTGRAYSAPIKPGCAIPDLDYPGDEFADMSYVNGVPVFHKTSTWIYNLHQ